MANGQPHRIASIVSRLLHSRWLWPAHRVHHTMTEMDVLGTSRNSVWSSALIVYLWVNGAVLYLLNDPTWFAAGAAVTAALDLWRHSPLTPRRGSTLWRVVSKVLGVGTVKSFANQLLAGQAMQQKDAEMLVMDVPLTTITVFQEIPRVHQDF